MNIYRNADGSIRIWLEDDEIEAIIEAELHNSGFYPTMDEPVVDIEGFIEEYLGASLDQYADLESDVLGLTEFLKGKAPAIKINRSLTQKAIDAPRVAGGILGRWRATVAHEGVHIIFHRSLFETPIDQVSLFEESAEDKAPGRVQCLKRDVSFKIVADWREYQANRGMAAMLMPRELFTRTAYEHCDLLGLDPLRLEFEEDNSINLAYGLSRFFCVSHQAAHIRLKTLGIVCPSGQTSFSMEKSRQRAHVVTIRE